MIIVEPKRCEGCTHLKGHLNGDVKVMDYCYVYDRKITDEAFDCKFYFKKVKE